MADTTLRFSVNSDQELIARETPTQRVVEIAVQAPQFAQPTHRASLNLALVLDRSGSMGGEKLNYVKKAALHVLDLLQEQDQVALVAYDDEVNLLSPSLPVTDENRIELKGAIQPLHPGGMTNLSGGWLAGCQEVASAARDDSLNRVLLLTDGLANHGITDLEELARHARELAIRGVTTSSFGVGEGFNEHLLEAMSNQGSGNFYYIGAPAEIPDLFQREFQELAAITAREVELRLEFPPDIRIQVLGGWRTEFSAGKARISLGSLNAGRLQELYLKLFIPPANHLAELKIQVGLIGKGEAGQIYEDRSELIFRPASQAEVEAAPRRSDLLERYARVDVAETANEALKLERHGKNAEASRLLNLSLQENAPYLDPQQAKDYTAISDRMRHGMDEQDRKTTHYTTYNSRRQREK